ncbi:MAG: hypothetical protein RLY66_574 [Candidatus Parcubacteria bacterium]|jgi:hypothetical protein
MVRITSKIEKLLRTNTALVFLCVISIGVLVIVFRGNGSRGDSTKSDVEVKTISGTVHEGEVVETNSAPAIAEAFRGMPEPSSYTSFVYEGDQNISITTKCNDDFSVIMIFPIEIDYRSDVASARYNSAEQCIAGKQKTEKVSISGFGFEDGHEYYIVKASQGKKGMWHDPY